MKKSEAGFTTTELLIAIQLTFLLIGFLYAGYSFSLRLSKTWRDRMALENAAAVCMRAMVHDIRQAATILRARDKELALLTDSGKQIVYQLQNGRIMRNGQPVSTLSTIMETITFRYATMNNEEVSRGFTQNRLKYFSPRTTSDKAQIALVRIELALANRGKQIRMTAAISPRNYHLRAFERL